MSEALTFLSAQFTYILRDVLGYVVPGAIVAGASIYFFRLESFKNADFKSKGTWIVAILLCYFIGHVVAGIAFNLWRGNPVYSYSPPSAGGDATHIESLSAFVQAVDRLTNNNAQQSVFRAERERLVVINHMSGIGSAAVAASILIAMASLLFHGDRRRRDLYAVLVLMLFSYGLWLEHKRFREVQYTFEQDVIRLARLAPPK